MIVVVRCGVGWKVRWRPCNRGHFLLFRKEKKGEKREGGLGGLCDEGDDVDGSLFLVYFFFKINIAG